MSYRSFKQEVVSAHIQTELEKDLVLAKGCNMEFEGEAKLGGQVRIPNLGRPTISTYSGSVSSPEDVPESDTLLTLDQASYFNYKIKDIDKAFAAHDFSGLLLSEAKAAMAEKIDSYVATMAKEAKGAMVASSAAYTTADGAYAALKAGLLKLRKNNVSKKTDIFCDISWDLYQLLVDKFTNIDTDNSDAVRRGAIKQMMGVYFRPTNLLYNDTTDDYIMLRTVKAISFAHGITEVEPYRVENDFSDAVKGLDVYGAKVTRPKELYVIKAHYA